MTDLNSKKLKVNSEKFPPTDWVETTLGFIPKDWKIIPANEFCEKVADGTHDSPKQSQDGKLLITSKNLKNGQLDTSSAYLISQKDFEEVNKRSKVDQWDILLSMIGTVGEVCLISEEPDFAIKNVGLFKCGNKSNAKWLYYFLRSSIGQNHLLSRLNGTTQKYITLSELRNFPIIVPTSPAEQVAITSVLSAFDDKIELLREQNKTLEEMGQTLFNEKCIVKNEKLPEGWRVFELSEIVDIVNGYAYKGSDLTENSKTALVTLKSFDRNGGFQTRGFKPFIGNPKETQEVKIGDLVVAHTDLTQDAEVLGNPALIFDDGGFEKMFVTMDLVKVISKDENITNAFLYYLMKTQEFKGHCVGYANGTTVLHLSKKAIPEYQIALPKNFRILSDVSLLLKETTDKIADINSQIQTLANTRDELLPRLMRGEVRVGLITIK